MNTEPVHLHRPDAKTTVCGRRDSKNRITTPYRSTDAPPVPGQTICPDCTAAVNT